MIAVSSPTFTGQIFIYGEDGRLTRSIGRAGSGPGEFTRMQFLAYGPGDSLHTMDAGGSRYSVFTPNYVFARSAELGVGGFGFQIDQSGTVYVVAPRQAATGRHALQVFSPAGTFLHSFDPIGPRAMGQADLRRHIAIDGQGAVWSIGATDYTLKKWGAHGNLLLQLAARRSWIADSIPTRLLPTQRLPGQIAGLAADSSVLWVYAIVADAHWSPETAVSPSAMYDTIVEAVDPLGHLLATRRFDAFLLPLTGNWAYSMLEDSTGEQRIQLWRVDLRRH